MQAAGNALSELDAVSGCRCNSVEVAGTPLKLQYTPDGVSLVLLTRVRRHGAARNAHHQRWLGWRCMICTGSVHNARSAVCAGCWGLARGSHRQHAVSSEAYSAKRVPQGPPKLAHRPQHQARSSPPPRPSLASSRFHSLPVSLPEDLTLALTCTAAGAHCVLLVHFQLAPAPAAAGGPALLGQAAQLSAHGRVRGGCRQQHHHRSRAAAAAAVGGSVPWGWWCMRVDLHGAWGVGRCSGAGWEAGCRVVLCMVHPTCQTGGALEHC